MTSVPAMVYSSIVYRPNSPCPGLETEGRRKMAMNVTSPTVREDLQKRLRRIEGQVRGVQKMIDEGRECQDIVQQLAAIRSAVHQTTLILVRSYASECLLKPDADSSPEEVVDNLIAVLNKVP